jgi:glycosyltransferase involved in cell wall biosynthesis
VTPAIPADRGADPRANGATETRGVASHSSDRPRRAVVLVGNPAAPYSRALRIARALAAERYAVEIAAIAGEGAPPRELDGAIEWHRYRPSGFFARMAATYRVPVPGKTGQAAPRTSIVAMPKRVARAVVGRFWRWAFWPHTVRGWWRTLARELPPADLYHACGSLTIAAALDARRRDRRQGRHSRVIYDAIDIVMESNNVLGIPGPVRRWLAWREARWARASDAIVTINDPFADRLVNRMGLTTRPVVVPNYPEPIRVPAGRPDRIRAALGLPATTRIVLFQGRLGPSLGLDESAEAIRHVQHAALVLLGFGRWLELCRARDSDPRYAGIHFTLPAVGPDELLEWTASADAALIPLPAISYNQRYTTPNKFLEAIAAGTPIVLGPDLPTMEEILRREGFGRVARSLAPADLAAAIRDVIDMPRSDMSAWRARIAAASAERYTWPVAAATYRALLRGIDERSSLAA